MLKSTRIVDLTQCEHLRLSLFDKMFCLFIRGTKVLWVNLTLAKLIDKNNTVGFNGHSQLASISYYLALLFPALCPRKADLCALNGLGSCPLVSGWVGPMGDTDRRMESGRRQRVEHLFLPCPPFCFLTVLAVTMLLCSPCIYQPATPAWLQLFWVW